jgi:hypothetical protein
MAIRKAGGSVVAIVGKDKPQCGRLSSGRPDLLQGRALAEELEALLCYHSLPRLFRPAAYDSQTNRFAPYTPQDFAHLGDFVGDVPVTLIEPPDLTLRELHRRATLRGMEQAGAAGRFPGRPPTISELVGQLIIIDRYARRLSLGKIAGRYGLTKSAVQRFLDRIEKPCTGAARGKVG